MLKLFRLYFHIILLIPVYFFCVQINAQSLDNIKDQQPILLNGFLSTNQVINTQPTDTGNITNYNSYYTGSLNLSIYGISTPVTFIYSNNQGNFTHPFNQFGMHPSYKWIKGHLGYASMNFSPYTLNSHLFLGAGVELDPPGLFYGSFMYGRLKKAIQEDTIIFQTPAYKRMGYGIKTGIGENGNFIEICLFRAYDDQNSINNENIQNPVQPQENSVMSISFNKKLLNNLTVTGEFASSYITTNMESEAQQQENAFLKLPTWFMPTRSSTINRHALKSNVTYNQSRFSIGAGYERVDPEYKTFGAYYFTNNLENMTLNFSINMLDQKITFSSNIGLQKDNLDNSKMNNTKRIVGAGNINIIPTEKLNLNMAYSNFSSYTNVRSTFDYINATSPYQNYDTLNYRQISQNTNFNCSYQLQSSNKQRQNINLNITWQTTNNHQGEDSLSNSNFYNAGINYLLSIRDLDLNCNASLNYNRTNSIDLTNNTWGPMIGVNKLFFEKTLRTSFSFSFNSAKTENFPPARTYNTRLGITYTLKQKHNINSSILFQKRENNVSAYATYNVSVGYTYTFNIIKPKENENN